MTTDTVKLAPSILTADFAHLGDQVAEAERAGADRIHVDVMDGHFVPNLSMGPPIVRSLRRATRLPLEAHLMISNPDFFVDEFAKAGQPPPWRSPREPTCWSRGRQFSTTAKASPPLCSGCGPQFSANGERMSCSSR